MSRLVEIVAVAVTAGSLALAGPAVGQGPAEPSGSGPSAPALSGTYFLQQQVTATCTQVSVSPSLWNCRGLGAVQPGPKGLLVTHVNCRAHVNGTPNKVEFSVGRGNSPSNLNDIMLYPGTYTQANGAIKRYAADAMVDFVVPAGNGVGFDSWISGTGITQVSVFCVYTARFATI